MPLAPAYYERHCIRRGPAMARGAPTHLQRDELPPGSQHRTREGQVRLPFEALPYFPRRILILARTVFVSL